jgi:hypothetical protein
MSYRTRVLGSVAVSAALVLSASLAAPAFAGDRKDEVCDAGGQASAKKPPDTRIKWNVKNLTKRTTGGSDAEPACKRAVSGGCKDPTPAEADGKVKVKGWDPEKKELIAGEAKADCMAINTKGGAAGPGPTPPKKKD